MLDPLFWLGLSILLVAVSITAVLMAALPAFQELSRAARSAEKLFDTLNRELPPTLEAIRLTSMEITELTDDMTEGMQNVGRMTQQVDEGMTGVRQQAKQAKVTTRSVVAGFKAALNTFVRPSNVRPSNRRNAPSPRLPASQVEEFEEIQEVDREEWEETRDPESMTISLEHHTEQSLHVQQSVSVQPAFNLEPSVLQNDSLQDARPETIAPQPITPAHHPSDSSHKAPAQNGNSHASQPYPSSVPRSQSAAEKMPQPAEAVREQPGYPD